VCFVLLVDTSDLVNITQQRLLHELTDVDNTSANQFHVGTDSADAGEFCGDFPTDDCHYIADYADNAACYGDHYDDNYQVILL